MRDVADEPEGQARPETGPGGGEFQRASEFLRAHLDSYEQLQILQLLARARDRTWTAEDVARALQLPPSEVAGALDHLCARNLLDIRISGELNFRYSPGSEDLRTRAEAFLSLLAQEPVAMAKVMLEHQRTRERSTALQAFVDAFMLRGRGRHG